MFSAALGLGQMIGGLFGASAASKAAKVQQQADNTAAANENTAIPEANDPITSAASTGQTNISTAAVNGANNIVNAGGAASQGATDAGTGANKILDPFVQSGDTAEGVLNSGVAAGGEFNSTPTLAQLQMDPSMAFIQQQQEQGMDRNAAAAGTAGSGGYMKDLASYDTGLASQEYQQAFNNYQTSTQNKFADVNAVAGTGQTAATTQGSNLINTAEYGGTANLNAEENAGALTTGATENGAQLTTQAAEDTGANVMQGTQAAGAFDTSGAAAQAGGIVGATNAVTGGISSGLNTMNNQNNLNNGLYQGMFAAPNYVSNPYIVNQASPKLPLNNPGGGGIPLAFGMGSGS